jgi:tetratricopeptide (TPR) repeat protein
MLRNKRFVGREDTIAELRRKLFASHGEQTVSLVGLGGVGKTQVAFQVAYWAKEHRPDHSVFWVSAMSSAAFDQTYTEIASKLAIRTHDQQDNLRKAVKELLETEEVGPWLLIVDNADDMEILFGPEGNNDGIWQYLPRSENGRTLVTTRSGEVAMAFGVDAVQLEAMDEDEAYILLETSLVWKTVLGDIDGVRQLLRELTFLPIAIVQAAAYLNRNRISVSQFLKLLNGSEEDVANLMSEGFQDTTQPGGLQRAVATTFLTSFKQITLLDPWAAELLSFISCVEPKAIPRSMLPPFASESAMVNAIGTLRAYAFIARRGTTRIFDMHSLVYLATRRWVRQQKRAAQVEEGAVQHLAKIFPARDYSQQDRWRAYMPHALGILRRKDTADMEQRYLLCIKAGRCLLADGRLKEASQCFSESYSWRKEHLPHRDPHTLLAQYELAQTYSRTGQVKIAISLMEEVVRIQKELLAEGHPSQLAAMHELAGAYEADGRLQEAVALFEEVVQVSGQMAVLAEMDIDHLASQHSLARAYLINGEVARAMALMQEVVRNQDRVLPQNHVDRLRSQHTLGRIYQANGQTQEAMSTLKEVVRIQTKILEKDHPFRLSSESCLALAFWDLGERTHAYALMNDVVHTYRQSFDENFPGRKSCERWLEGFRKSTQDVTSC